MMVKLFKHELDILHFDLIMLYHSNFKGITNDFPFIQF